MKRVHFEKCLILKGRQAALDADRTAAPAPPPEPVALRRNRDFNLLWSGQAVSALGNELSEIGYPLLVLALTGSAARAGLVGSAELVAMLAALLPAGVVADRRPRKQVMLVSSLIQLLALASVAAVIVVHHVYLAHLMAAGAVEGTASAFYIGANRGALRRIVPPSQLSLALSRTQARDQAAALVGPPLGGVLFSFSRLLPFALDAASFGAITVATALIRGPVDPEPRTPDAAATGATSARIAADPNRESTLRRVTLGLRQIAANDYLRTVAMWAAVVNMVATGLLLLTIVLARYRGAGPATIGAVTATYALGGLVGALLAPRLIARFSSRRLVLVASWLLAPCPVVMALAPSPWLIAAGGALSVCAIAPVNIILLTRVAELTPHRMQGQTGNAMLLIGSSLKWPAPAVFGLLADRYGPVTAVLAGGGVYAATAVWLQGRTVLRQLDAPVAEVPEPVGGLV